LQGEKKIVWPQLDIMGKKKVKTRLKGEPVCDECRSEWGGGRGRRDHEKKERKQEEDERERMGLLKINMPTRRKGKKRDSTGQKESKLLVPEVQSGRGGSGLPKKSAKRGTLAKKKKK